MKKNKKFWPLLLLALAVIVILLFLRGKNQEEKSHKESSEKAFIKVTVVTPKFGELTETVSLNGVVAPREAVIISTELSGIKVKNIFAEAGEVVKKNQKLAELDGSVLLNDLEQIRANYNLAKDEYEKAKILKEAEAVSNNYYLEKTANYQSLRASLANAELNITRVNILAPFSGVLFERKAEIGALVTANQPLFQLVKNGQLDVEGQVTEDVLPLVKIGNDAVIQIIGFAENIRGKVRVIAPNIDQDSRTAMVKIALPRDEKKIAIGAFASAKIVINKKSGFLLPVETLLQDDQGYYVYGVNSENRVLRYDVNLRLRDDKNALVAVIPQDSKIILKAGSFVREGDLVEPINGDAQ